MNITPPGKQIAVIAYVPFVGFLIAFFMNNEDHYAFAVWHIKNMFGLFLMFIVALIVQSQIDFLAGDIIWFITFLTWLFCWLMAILNRKKGIPYLSEKFQEWFTFLD